MESQYSPSQYHPEEVNIQKYFDVLRRRWPIALVIFGTSLGLASVAASLQAPSYKAEGNLLFELNRTSSLLEVNSSLEQLKSLNAKTSPLNTQAVILQSAPILETAIDELKLRNDKGKRLEPKDILENLTVETVVGTDVLKVSYKAKNPELAASLVNHVMQAYLANDILNNRAESRAAREFITSQLPTTEQAVDQAAEALRQFLEQNQIVSLQAESGRLVSLMSELDSKINGAQAQLLDLNAQIQELNRQAGLPADQAVPLNALNQSKGVQEVLGQLQSAQQRLAQARTLYTDNNPKVAALRDEETALRSLLSQRVTEIVGTSAGVTPGLLQLGPLQQSLASKLVENQVTRQGLEQQLRALLEVRELYRNKATLIPALQKRQEELERKLNAAQGIYESLLKKLQEIRVAENQNVGNARIIQAAKVPRTSSSKLAPLLLGGGGFMGLTLGIAAAFLADLLDRSVRTVADAQALLGYPLLGLIPHYKTVALHGQGEEEHFEGISPRIVVANSPRSMVNESYQMLRANLKFASTDHPIQSLVITSAVPGEGKSEVSANLAAAMAQMGRRVLLIDADLRSPTQHHLWGLMNAVGLSNVIVGQEKLEHAIQTVTNRLSVLTAGVVPPNPIALLDSNRMAQILKLLAKQYDYIIFDTPPLAGMADAAVLGTMVDGLLLVAQPGVVNVDSAKIAKQILERSAPNVLGLVANGVNLKQNGDGHFYYYSRDRNTPPTHKTATPSASSPRKRRSLLMG